MNIPLPAMLLILATTLAVLIWALGDLAAGWEQRRRLAARSYAGDEHGLDGPMSRLDRRLRKAQR